MKQKIVLGENVPLPHTKIQPNMKAKLKRKKMVRASATSKIEQRRADTGNRKDWRKKTQYGMI